MFCKVSIILYDLVGEDSFLPELAGLITDKNIAGLGMKKYKKYEIYTVVTLIYIKFMYGANINYLSKLKTQIKI